MNTISTVTTINENPKQEQQRQTAKEILATNVKSLIEQLEAEHSDALTAYLDAMSRFHNYSFTQLLPTLNTVPTAYSHEFHAELLYDLSAALVREGLGGPETWRKCEESAVVSAQRAIIESIGEERRNLLQRNVEYHVSVSDIAERSGEDAVLGDGRLAVTIECSGGSGFLKIGPPIAALEEEAWISAVAGAFHRRQLHGRGFARERARQRRSHDRVVDAGLPAPDVLRELRTKGSEVERPHLFAASSRLESRQRGLEDSSARREKAAGRRDDSGGCSLLEPLG
ncbi:MAG: hypothetical protein M3O02_08785 [Acidobacteriota bacterium]|nr:hypothetical protein [Acidobacteriota bacterium]